MKFFYKVAEGIDAMPLMLAIQRQPHLWDANRQRTTRPNTAHADVSDIWLRFQSSKETDDFATGQKPHLSVWYPAYYALPEVRPIVFGLMARVEGEQLGGVLITKIPPGGKIDPHTDSGWHVDFYSKFYVSLISRPGANFYCGDEASGVEKICPAVGDVWYFDNTKPHWVENDSDDDRVTLICCIRTHHFGAAAWS